MRIILILLLPFLLVAGETEVELPTSVERALNSFDADVLKAQTRYRGEVEDAKEDLIRILDREMEQATKKGDLELALAIKTKKEVLADYTAGGLAELDFLGNEMEEKFNIDRDNMTVQKWTSLRGVELTIDSRTSDSDPIVCELPPGTFAVVQHPEDRWGTSNTAQDSTLTGYVGTGGHKMYLVTKTKDFEKHALDFTLDKKQTIAFYVSDPRPGNNVGSIRIKILKLK